MNLINKDKLTKDFEEECVGECGCCRHSIRGTGECGFIAEFPVEIELVRCQDCKHGRLYDVDLVDCELNELAKDANFFCADGERKAGEVE